MNIKKPFFIAEVGVNHEGDIEKAIDMIESAADAGADCVKFQMYKADELAITDSPAYWDTTKEKTKSQHLLFSKFDGLSIQDYKTLADECSKRNVEFMVTPFSRAGVKDAKNICSRLKIASADITNIPLIEEAAKTNLPIILSTGAASYEEVSNAVDLVTKYNDKKITLLHCVLNYPTDPKNAFLKRIEELRERFPQCYIGYSDHVPPQKSEFTLLTSIICGAEVIEKHYTFDKNIPGNDHYHAFDHDDLVNFYKSIEELKELYGVDFDEKKFLSIQEPAILNARRSLVSKIDIKKGQTLTAKNLDTKRPGSGIPSSRWNEFIGKEVLEDIPADSLIQKSQVK
tara:strand:+ start:8732 stop:9760 length:1029 start_codon:yes stop_codon:yes gene_type:complete